MPGKNSFIVRVDAHLDESTIPTMRTSDFWKYGGLTRDVGLITEPATYIARYHVYLHSLEKNEIRGWIQLAGKSTANQLVKVDIGDVGIETHIRTDDEGRGEFTVQARNLELWSPQSPRLYNVTLSLEDITLRDRIGFRTVSTQGQKILLNGQPMTIRGISMHEETVLHPGLSTSREDVLAQFELVKELNANFVRLAHYPHNEHTVKLADEMGLMLWSEVPIVSLIDWDNPATLAVAKSQLVENVTRDLNRASVVTWSISNESFPQSQARLDFLSALAAIVRNLDDSGRPIASALMGNPKKEFADIGKHLFAQLLRNPELPAATREQLMAMVAAASSNAAKAGATAGAVTEGGSPAEMHVIIDDPLGEIVDIVGYNEYFGWYYSRFFAQSLGVDEGLMRNAMLSIMPNIRFENAFGKPMIISEFGAGAKAGFHSDRAIIWSEEYQARVYTKQLEMLEKSSYVNGFTPWILKDFRSHLRELNGIQETFNRKGLVSETGEKKMAFGVLSKFYRKQAVETGERFSEAKP
jgi:beta-glucuronidase